MKKCKCGKPYEGVAQQAFADADPDEDTEPEFESEPEDDVVEAEEDDESVAEEEPVTNDEWKNRTLCSDPACIGVIGPDGRCKECGKPYKGS